LNSKTIIAIILIGLFVVSLAAVLITPKQTTQTTQTGYVNVSREENYWMGQSNNTLVSRYLVNYGFVAVEDTPTVTVTDKTDPNLLWVPIVQDSTNVQVSYNNATGEITVVATNMKAGDKLFAQAAFQMDPVNIFASGQSPSTQVSPSILNYGDDKNVTITISPFTVQKTSNITEVGVYAWFTEAAANITSISTTPPVKVDAPQYQAIWQYTRPTTFSYDSHTAVYNVKITTYTAFGDVILRTWVEARYSNPLRMKIDGKIEGAKGYFFRVDSGINYQYQHLIGTSS